MHSTNESRCFCESGKEYQHCCQVFIESKELPATAEQLMRSRYTAYVLVKATYLVETTHPKVRHMHSKKAITQWAKENKWTGLEVIKSDASTVEFKAYFIDSEQEAHCHYEYSTFEKLGEKWYYVSGTY